MSEPSKAPNIVLRDHERKVPGEQLKGITVAALRNTFEAAGIEFIPENGGGPGVRLSRNQT
ncbi:transcriptional regulator [Mesorhizobium sp. B3-1-3]|nr:transcriptional regulator [Mesorhizobium sp. B3-1-8]TPI63047.1 transcriptional regulator [Mesorhizobium sp. B3-1-3]